MSDLQKIAGKVSSHLSISWTCDLRVIESGPVEIECVMELSSCLHMLTHIFFHHMGLSENRVPTSKQDEPSFSPIFKCYNCPWVPTPHVAHVTSDDETTKGQGQPVRQHQRLWDKTSVQRVGISGSTASPWISPLKFETIMVDIW